MKIVFAAEQNNIVCPIRFYRVVEGPEFTLNDPEVTNQKWTTRLFDGKSSGKNLVEQVDRGAMVGMAVMTSWRSK
jgi:hypothetical protein